LEKIKVVKTAPRLWVIASKNTITGSKRFIRFDRICRENVVATSTALSQLNKP